MQQSLLQTFGIDQMHGVPPLKGEDTRRSAVNHGPLHRAQRARNGGALLVGGREHQAASSTVRKVRSESSIASIHAVWWVGATVPVSTDR